MIKSKIVLFILFAFWSDLCHPCFSKFFKLILCEKKCLLGVFATHFASGISPSLVVSLNGPILKFFNFEQRVSQLETWPTKVLQLISQVTNLPNLSRLVCESTTREMPRINFLKGNLWDICFKLLSSSPKPLFQFFYIKTQLNPIVFYSINISKVIFNSFHWFWSLYYVFGGFYVHSWDFLKWDLENLFLVKFFCMGLFLLMICYGCWPLVAIRTCIKGRFHHVHAFHYI